VEKPAAFLKLLSSGRTFGDMFVRKAVFRQALHGTGVCFFVHIAVKSHAFLYLTSEMKDAIIKLS